jgi:hypothetical protein
LLGAVAEFFNETVDTKPAQRAAAIAEKIHSNHPDLVALQEVGILRKGSGSTPNDPKIPATDVVHDQLQLLRDALTGLHEHYDTVAVIPNSDVQFPSALNFVVRITDRTVILARASPNDLKLSNAQVEEYWAKPPVPPAASGLIIPMFGWGSAYVVGMKLLPDVYAVQRVGDRWLLVSASEWRGERSSAGRLTLRRCRRATAQSSPHSALI